MLGRFSCNGRERRTVYADYFILHGYPLYSIPIFKKYKNTLSVSFSYDKKMMLRQIRLAFHLATVRGYNSDRLGHVYKK